MVTFDLIQVRDVTHSRLSPESLSRTRAVSIQASYRLVPTSPKLLHSPIAIPEQPVVRTGTELPLQHQRLGILRLPDRLHIFMLLGHRHGGNRLPYRQSCPERQGVHIRFCQARLVQKLLFLARNSGLTVEMVPVWATSATSMGTRTAYTP